MTLTNDTPAHRAPHTDLITPSQAAPPAAASSADPLASWREALTGHFGPVHENDPQPGFWRTRPDRQGRSSAIAIWRDGQKVLALRDGRPVEPCDVWTWCCQWPIPYDLYVRVAEQGEPWPDALPTIGHNSGALVPNAPPAVPVDPAVPPAQVPLVSPSDDAVAATSRLRHEIEALWEHAWAWLSSLGTILTQEMADKAANFAERFATLEAEAEGERVRLKKPLLQRIKAIDGAWLPVVDSADKAKAAMKKAVEPFLEGEWERALLEGGGAPGQPPAAGTTGRRIALRTQTSVQLRNVRAAVRHYAGDTRFHGDGQVQKATQRLALGDLSEGKRVPGAALVSTRRAV